MMEYMRRQMKTILWIIVITFVGTIFVSWGIGTSVNRTNRELNRVAVVNKEDITPQEYYNQLQSARENFKRLLGDNYTDELAEKLNIENQTLEYLIRMKLLQQKAKEMGIFVSNDEVIAKIKTWPQFQTNGQFDAAKYNSAITNPRNAQMLPTMEKEVRDQLLVDKMELLIKNSVTVTEQEIRDLFTQKNDQFQFAYVMLKPADLVPKEAVQKYYEEHKDDFKSPERVAASHILLKIETTEADTLAKAQKLREEIISGASFAQMARKNSADDTNAKDGGELGYFVKGQMVPEFEDVAFKLPVGEVSQPVKTQFGYHLIKVTEHQAGKVPPLKDVYDRVAQIAQTDEGAKASELMTQIKAKAVETGSLDAAAKSFKLDVALSNSFKENTEIAPNIPWNEQLGLAAAALAIDQISEPVTTSQGVFLVQLKQHLSGEEKEYQKQRPTLQQDLLVQKRDAVLENWYDALRSTAKVEILLADYETKANSMNDQ